YLLMDVILKSGLPKGHVNLICGPGSTIGRYLLEEEQISKYSFTGSFSIGKYLKESSGMRKVSLELGNNSPNIVHHDADIDLAAKLCVMRGYTNSGQACISAQRIYVHQNIKEEFIKKLVH